MRHRWDAVIVGAGPNGLAAAITFARAGYRVVVFEAATSVGGGVRSSQLTLPGFVHDTCSTIYPFALASPFFDSLPLASLGVRWGFSPAQAAHPLDDGSAVIVERSVEATRRALDREGLAYAELIGGVVADWPQIKNALLGPLAWPEHPVALLKFGHRAWRSASHVARRCLSGPRSQALLGGMAAHGMLPLEKAGTAGIGMTLATMAHAVGWPLVRGGAQRLADAMAACLSGWGGEIVTGAPIGSLDELPSARVVLCDVAPRDLVRLAGDRLPRRYRRALLRYEHRVAACKVDWALDGPIPWTAPECARAATVHLGGTFEEIARSEHDAWHGRAPERPFVLLTQPSLFDTTRAPPGLHTGWAYCHLPAGADADMTARIEQQVERFAPGFRDRILARATRGPADLERYNANYVGGDIATGSHHLLQLLRRPTFSWHRTPVAGLYLCSAATPPGVGVHGMCGYLAAIRALEREFGRDPASFRLSAAQA